MDVTILPSCHEEFGHFHVKIVLDEGGNLQPFSPYRYCDLVKNPVFIDVQDPTWSGCSPERSLPGERGSQSSLGSGVGVHRMYGGGD